MDHERLRGLLGGLAAARRPRAAPPRYRRARRARHAPGHRLGADLDVAQLRAEIAAPRSASRGSPRASSFRATSRSASARWRARRDRRAAAPSRSRSCARRAPRSWSPRKSSARASPPSSADAQLRAPRRRARAQPPRAARPRPGRRSRDASTRPRSRSRRARAARRSPSSRAISAAARNASSASTALPAAVARACRARGSTSARSARRSIPSSSAVRSRAAASSNASAAAAARAAARLYSTARPVAAERRRGGEVVGEVGERAAEPPVAASSASPTRRCSSARRAPREPVVERPAHELVGEAVGEPARRQLLDHPAAHRLVERGQQLGVPRGRRPADDVELELRPTVAASSSRSLVAGRQAREPLADDLAHALGRAELGERPRERDRAVDDLDRAGLDERAPQLADQERVALGQVADRPRELREPGAESAPAARRDELGHLVAGEPGEPQPDDVVGPAQVGERLRRASPAPRPRCRGTWRAAARARRRPAAPGGAAAAASDASAQCPSSSTSSTGRVSLTPVEQVGDGGVQAVALGVGIGLDRRRQLADPRREVGEQPRELAAAGAERGAQLGRLDARARAARAPRRTGRTACARPRRRRRRGRARRRSPPRPRTRARAGSCPSRARRRPARRGGPRPGAVGIERAQRLQLARAPDERERRGEAKRAGKVGMRTLHGR